MNRRYINQIIRKLNCSRKKREEIKRQLISDISVEIESGENEQDVLSRMGTADEIAEEFNSSFSEEEGKLFKKEKWMKRIGIIILTVVIIAGVIWWVIPKQIWIEESKIFDKDTVMQQAEMVVEYLDADDYDALKKISDEKMEEIMMREELESAKAQIGPDWGERQSVGKIYVLEVTQMGRKNAVVQMNVSYENENVMYTLFFNRDMELEGLWMQ